jgi:biopolymer transport protein ExbD
MAFAAGQDRSLGRSRFRGATGTLSEINVVPLVDVVLVLLIIFMLTAHVMEFGLEVEVPKVIEVRDTTEELPVVTINRNGEVHLAETPVNLNLLGGEIRRRYPGHNAVYLRGDKNSRYEIIAHVVSALGRAKLNVRLVTQPVDESDRPGR